MRCRACVMGYEDFAIENGSGYGPFGASPTPSPMMVRVMFFEAVPGNNCSGPSNLYMRENASETVDIGQYTFLAANYEGSGGAA